MSEFEKIKNKIIEIKRAVPIFLEHQKSSSVPGYYSYSFSSDIYNDTKHWNVGSSAYALKIMYTLGYGREHQDVIDACNYIDSFIHRNGTIYDDNIKKKSNMRNFLSSLKHGNFSNLFNTDYIRAESRQCYSAKLAYGYVTNNVAIDYIPKNIQDIELFLSRLKWNQPWGAGSHFSHLLFFQKLMFQLGEISQIEYDENVNFAIDWVNNLQNSNDGCWYEGKTSAQQIINGAMKVISGLRTVDKCFFSFPDKIIDFCLKEINSGHACDNFDIIYVLYYASLIANDYRYDEIIKYAENRFDIFMNHYKENQGGFSFYSDHCNINYYGAKITYGTNESDIHATALFMWGITIIAKLLKINDSEDISLQEVIT